MACPHFIPVTPMRHTDPRAAMLPLGDEWAGECVASGSAVAVHPCNARLCNLGYGRGECPYFPDSGEADAVRFAIASVQNGLIRIHYAEERDHLPHAHGAIECSGETGAAMSGDGSPLYRQAAAYAASYLRRVRS